jgi:hypothetical protein
LAERAAEWCAAWGETCADYYRAAALYEELRPLSDAELNRRRLSRATLARDILRACDRSNGASLEMAARSFDCRLAREHN